MELDTRNLSSRKGDVAVRMKDEIKDFDGRNERFCGRCGVVDGVFRSEVRTDKV